MQHLLKVVVEQFLLGLYLNKVGQTHKFRRLYIGRKLLEMGSLEPIVRILLFPQTKMAVLLMVD
uniref:Uncharacterized protein n=1 Tax=virus sp. ctPYc18 TaxID=2828251 RepID=A0A8S5RCH8_9VIRU|nr:MAG TPA: hypothetical protein [virus sp. ctPYc18]